MQKLNWNSLILLSTIVLFLWAIVFALYGKDSEILENKEYISNCEYTLFDNVFTINANCINQKRLPQLTLVEVIDEVWNQIEWFSEYYEPYSTSFNYYWATPKFKTKWNPYLQWNEKSDQLINEATKHRKKIKITYNELAQYYAEHLSYFVADKDLTNLWKCSRINYELALDSVNNYFLWAWDTLNINQRLSWIDNYCKWKTEEEYLFYGGVCGMVSQLFRVSLVNPEIIVTKRFPHSEWFVQYYGENVWWDDAAIYERSKQFEIQNIWKSDIIIKTSYTNNHSIMIAISWPTNKWVNISKNSINWRKLAVHLEKSVYKSDGNIDNLLRTEIFDSYYTKKTYESR